MDHSHQHHHHHHPSPDSSTTTTESPTTVAATLLHAVMTTMVSHHGQGASQHAAGHSLEMDRMAGDGSIVADMHSTHNSVGDHNMPMFFHFGVDSIILFKEWTTSSTQGIIASVIGIFILAMIYEGIKFFREYLFKKYFTSLEYSSVSVLGDDGKPVTEVHKVARNRMLSWPHLLQTLLHIIQMILSYFLMLIFMTFNVWLCVGVILGAGFGYFLFGWRKATVVDITEHCH